MLGLELVSVSKVYANGQRAVNRVSLGVDAGRMLVLVGPSGCGKSSLLRMIAGLEDISEGEVRIAGQVVNERAPKERDVAMVFQNYALYPHMTVFENLAFGLRMRRRPPAEVETAVRESAAMLGLDAKLDRKPRELSGGERQRVALGRAMVRRPQVFLFDEPLSNLDARLRVQVRGEIHRLHQRIGATMVYVTHDQVEAMTLGDQIAVLDRGELQQMADPATLYDRPANRFVAGFIGSPPMNFIPVRIDAQRRAQLADGAAVVSGVPEPLVAQAGGAVVLGVRPEDLSLEANGAGASFDTVLEVRESLGNEVLLYWSSAGGPITSRLAGSAGPRVGERLRLHAPLDRLRWFDAASGVALA